MVVNLPREDQVHRPRSPRRTHSASVGLFPVSRPPSKDVMRSAYARSCGNHNLSIDSTGGGSDPAFPGPGSRTVVVQVKIRFRSSSVSGRDNIRRDHHAAGTALTMARNAGGKVRRFVEVIRRGKW